MSHYRHLADRVEHYTIERDGIRISYDLVTSHGDRTTPGTSEVEIEDSLTVFDADALIKYRTDYRLENATLREIAESFVEDQIDG